MCASSDIDVTSFQVDHMISNLELQRRFDPVILVIDLSEIRKEYSETLPTLIAELGDFFFRYDTEFVQNGCTTAVLNIGEYCRMISCHSMEIASVIVDELSTSYRCHFRAALSGSFIVSKLLLESEKSEQIITTDTVAREVITFMQNKPIECISLPTHELGVLREQGIRTFRDAIVHRVYIFSEFDEFTCESIFAACLGIDLHRVSNTYVFYSESVTRLIELLVYHLETNNDVVSFLQISTSSNTVSEELPFKTRDIALLRGAIEYMANRLQSDTEEMKLKASKHKIEKKQTQSSIGKWVITGHEASIELELQRSQVPKKRSKTPMTLDRFVETASTQVVPKKPQKKARTKGYQRNLFDFV